MANLQVFQAGDPRRDVFLLGNARSGTSWLMGLLACAPGYRTAFEPLSEWVVQAERKVFRHFHPGDPTAEIFPKLQNILYQPWPDDSPFHRLSPIRRPYASQTIVKLVDANYLLGWIAEHFPAKVILLRRRPLEVARSRIRLGWRISPGWKRYYCGADFQCGELRPFLPLIESLRDSAPLADQYLAVSWLENWLGTRLAHKHGALVVDHEDLKQAPEQHFPPIFAHLGLPEPPAFRELLRRPSKTSWPEGKGRALEGCEEERLHQLQQQLEAVPTS